MPKRTTTIDDILSNYDVVRHVLTNVPEYGHFPVGLSCRGFYNTLDDTTYSHLSEFVSSTSLFDFAMSTMDASALSQYDVCSVVARHGTLDVLKYALDQMFPFTHDTFTSAVARGDLRIVQFLLDRVPQGLLVNIEPPLCTTAARHGRLGVLEYLHERGFPWNLRTHCEAAENGQLEILKYLHEKYLDENGCEAAKNRLKILKNLHGRNREAAERLFGHLE
jgi:hypothetical protein